MKDNNPPEDPKKVWLKIVVVASKRKPYPIRNGSSRIVAAQYDHGWVFWADGYPMAFLVNADRADPERKNYLEFAAACPPDVAAEIGAYAWHEFREVFPAVGVERPNLFLIAKDVAEILARIAKG